MELSATAANPEPAQPDEFEVPAQPSNGPRGQCAQPCSGYYADLHKGK